MNIKIIKKYILTYFFNVIITIAFIVIPALLISIPDYKDQESKEVSAKYIDEKEIQKDLTLKIKDEMKNNIKDNISIFSSNNCFKKTYYINENGVKMYSDSNNKSDVLKCLDKDEEIIAYNEKDGYIYCEDNNGNKGWILKDGNNLNSIIINKSRYLIDLNITKQLIKVYDGKQLIKDNIKCSSGIVGDSETETPIGMFTIKKHQDIYFKSLKYNENVKYPLKFFSNYLIHSVPMSSDGKVNKEEYNNLGKAVSHGCIRVEEKNAQWLYKNIPDGTTLYIHY